jgi:hypothetical protein
LRQKVNTWRASFNVLPLRGPQNKGFQDVVKKHYLHDGGGKAIDLRRNIDGSNSRTVICVTGFQAIKKGVRRRRTPS